MHSMSDSLDKYVPEFDDEAMRARLELLTHEQLLEMLLHEYKLKRVIAKMLDSETEKLRRIEVIATEPSKLLGMPGVPSADDLRRMIEEE